MAVSLPWLIRFEVGYFNLRLSELAINDATAFAALELT